MSMNGLKPKSIQVLDKLLADPKISQTDAYAEVHSTSNRQTARTNAHKLVKSTSAQIYLQKHIDKAQKRIVELISTDKEDIALRASQDVMDRAHGKATQRVEQHKTGITLTIDLTSSLVDDPEPISAS